jgi:DNA (cytosine-5)-methyltransferase 1
MESRKGELLKLSLSAIDLFCGAGGFSLGLRNAGFELRGALDNDRRAIETYVHNFGPIGFHADATKFEITNFGWLEDLTVVVGGPPCQGFSIQRRGTRDDARNRLVQVFLDMALSLRPRFFVIENVLGLVSKHGKEFHEYVEQSKRCRLWRSAGEMASSHRR